MTSQLEQIIDAAWEDRANVTLTTKGEIRESVETALDMLDKGEKRVAEKVDGEWVVNQWLKKAVLLSFRLNDMKPIPGGPGGAHWWDKVPSKFEDMGENAFRAAGFRAGWMVISGAKYRAENYIEGLDMLASMRLCANVPSQHAIQTALGGYQSIGDLVLPTGRLGRQRDKAWDMLSSIPGVSCVKPKSALYLFPRLDPKVFPFQDDEAFALDLLRQEKVLIVQGTAFNWPDPDHFRVVFLPRMDDLEDSIGRIANYLDRIRKK